ncbi:MAG TPA: hypothetical protein VGZ29_09195 [Terriglobia bacterium]|nr:hypothetical protein [Terriglobia bacterium]
MMPLLYTNWYQASIVKIYDLTTGFTAKDFRTWAGTSLALLELEELGAAQSATAARPNAGGGDQKRR